MCASFCVPISNYWLKGFECRAPQESAYHRSRIVQNLARVIETASAGVISVHSADCYGTDPYLPRVLREPISEDIDVAILGSGFSVIRAGYYLNQTGA
jgi:hypothetical protein